MPKKAPEPEPATIRQPVFDPDGNFMAWVSPSYAAAARHRGEVVQSEEGHLVVVPQPIKQLDPETKRRLHLAKVRKNQ